MALIERQRLVLRSGQWFERWVARSWTEQYPLSKWQMLGSVPREFWQCRN